jgi:hypothetical protein
MKCPEGASGPLPRAGQHAARGRVGRSVSVLSIAHSNKPCKSWLLEAIPPRGCQVAHRHAGREGCLAGIRHLHSDCSCAGGAQEGVRCAQGTCRGNATWRATTGCKLVQELPEAHPGTLRPSAPKFRAPRDWSLSEAVLNKHETAGAVHGSHCNHDNNVPHPRVHTLRALGEPHVSSGQWRERRSRCCRCSGDCISHPLSSCAIPEMVRPIRLRHPTRAARILAHANRCGQAIVHQPPKGLFDLAGQGGTPETPEE